MTSIIKYFLPPIMIFALVSCGIVDSEQITDIMEKKQQIANQTEKKQWIKSNGLNAR